MDEFLRGYLSAALWTAINPDTDQPLCSADWAPEDFAPDTMNRARGECRAFLDLASKAGFFTLCGVHRAGFDFWLTRCRHGAGLQSDHDGTVISLAWERARFQRFH